MSLKRCGFAWRLRGAQVGRAHPELPGTLAAGPSHGYPCPHSPLSSGHLLRRASSNPPGTCPKAISLSPPCINIQSLLFRSPPDLLLVGFVLIVKALAVACFSWIEQVQLSAWGGRGCSGRGGGQCWLAGPRLWAPEGPWPAQPHGPRWPPACHCCGSTQMC